MYAKPKLISTRLLNTKNYNEIAADPDYIRIVFDIRYKWKIDNMTRLKPKANSQSRKWHLIAEGSE